MFEGRTIRCSSEGVALANQLHLSRLSALDRISEIIRASLTAHPKSHRKWFPQNFRLFFTSFALFSSNSLSNCFRFSMAFSSAVSSFTWELGCFLASWPCAFASGVGEFSRDAFDPPIRDFMVLRGVGEGDEAFRFPPILVVIFLGEGSGVDTRFPPIFDLIWRLGGGEPSGDSFAESSVSDVLGSGADDLSLPFCGDSSSVSDSLSGWFSELVLSLLLFRVVGGEESSSSWLFVWLSSFFLDFVLPLSLPASFETSPLLLRLSESGVSALWLRVRLGAESKSSSSWYLALFWQWRKPWYRLQRWQEDVSFETEMSIICTVEFSTVSRFFPAVNSGCLILPFPTVVGSCR